MDDRLDDYSLQQCSACFNRCILQRTIVYTSSCQSIFKQTRGCASVLVWLMDGIRDLVGAAPNVISWTTYHGVDHLNGQLRPQYTDSRSLLPRFQIWDLHMFETARRRFVDRSVRYTLRMGVGAAGPNRYNLSMRGRLDKDPDPDAFLGQIERCLTETTLSTFETSGCSWCLCSSLL
ncbi:hypothetical protein EDD86DRAFT_131618 [Gorgonomyces haynaldii]|nr:hypothetical protein EDD86DRAFT_131618 [Gorgonomyces haynaldii]